MRAWVLAAVLLLAPVSARPQPAPFSPEQRTEIIDIVRIALKTDPTILRDAVAALQQDERQAQLATARTAIEHAGDRLTRTQGDPTAGAAQGDVTLVEFYDLRCPYCRKMVPVIAELLQADPKLRLVYKDIPILGPASMLGARAVLAAQRQGGYQKLHDAIMASSQPITEEALQAQAGQLGLDWPRLRHDMDDPAIQSRIRANLELSQALGITGTPGYVIGRKLLPGAVGLGELQAAVAAARAG